MSAEIEDLITRAESYYSGYNYDQTKALFNGLLKAYRAIQAELERERMRLAACGTAALGYFDGCAEEYKSASLSDVLRLQARAESAEAKIKELKAMNISSETGEWKKAFESTGDELLECRKKCEELQAQLALADKLAQVSKELTEVLTGTESERFACAELNQVYDQIEAYKQARNASQENK